MKGKVGLGMVRHPGDLAVLSHITSFFLNLHVTQQTCTMHRLVKIQVVLLVSTYQAMRGKQDLCTERSAQCLLVFIKMQRRATRMDQSHRRQRDGKGQCGEHRTAQLIPVCF